MLTDADWVIIGYSWPYFLFFISIVVLYLFKENKRQDLISCTFFIIAISIFVGIADMLGGYDRYIYSELFDEIADITQDKENTSSYAQSALLNTYPTEIAYDALNIVISFLTGNRYIFVFIVTSLFYSLLFYSIKQYANNYSMFIILFLGFMFFFTFTYFRQMLAVGVTWLSIKYVIKKDFVRFAITIFVASLFHNSAIIFFFVYFLPIRKFAVEKVLIIMIGCFLLGMQNIMEPLFRLFGLITDSNRIDGYTDAGIRIDYIIEAFVFLFIILRHYSRIGKRTDNIIFLNISLACCAILLMFIRSENGGRLSWFFLCGIFVLVSNISMQYNKSSIFNFTLILLSFFLFFRIILLWRGLIVEYKTFFTPGHRSYDYIYEKYEYDEQYDVDKFYRPTFWLYGK